MANIEATDNTNNSIVDEPSEEEEIDESLDQAESDGPDESGVSEIFQRLSSAGAAIKRVPSSVVTQQKLQCVTCQKAFPNRSDLHRHLVARHVQMPDLILEKLPSDDDASDEENEQDWSDEEQDVKVPIKPASGMGVIDKYLTGIPGIIIKKTNETVGASLSIKPKTTAQEDVKFTKIALKQVSAPVQNSVSNLNRNDTESPPQKIMTPGALRMTIKHSGDRDNFQIIGARKSVIKTEAVAPVETDSKTGIVENYLTTQIKVESASVTTAQVPSVPIKSEPEDNLADHIKVKSFANRQTEVDVRIPKPIIVPKKEPHDRSSACVVIELNGDSDKDDDDDAVIFVPSSPPPDKKPALGFPSIPRKPHITEIDSTPPPVSSGSPLIPPPLTMLSGMVSSSPTRLSVTTATTSCPPSQVSTAKQHNFSWNPPVSGVRDPFEATPADRSSDALLESLLAPSGQRKDTDLGPSEYISLDRLGPQHTCEVCKTRFTDLNLLDRHQKATGHSSQLVMTNMTSGAVLPSYKNSNSDPSNFLSSLFPAKLAETVGKLAGGQPFTQQQNIMVNIQSFPGGIGQPNQPGQSNMPQGYGFPGAQTMQNPYPQQSYGQAPPGQYPPQYPQQQQPYGSDVYSQYQQQAQPGMYNRHPTPQPGYGPPGSYQNVGQYGYPMPSLAKPGAYPQGVSGHAPTPNQMQIGANPEVPNLPDPNLPAPQTSPSSGIRIQNLQQSIPGQKPSPGTRAPGPASTRGMMRGCPRMSIRGRGARAVAGVRPSPRPGSQFQGQAIRGPRPGMIRANVKRPAPAGNGASQSPKRRPDMLLPDRNDNEDCQVMSMQRQRENLPLIQSIQGSKEKAVQLSDQITVTKTRVRPPTPPPVAKDAGAVANMLAMRGIKITQKPKSPSPPPVVIPNLGSGISITKSSGAAVSNFSIAGDHDVSCSMCSKTFSNSSALSVHMSQMHSSAVKNIRCDSCPASYSTVAHLQEHKRVFHNQGTAAEMGIPVVDLSHQSNIRKLSSLGIVNFIPLANREQGGGCFGIPVISATNSMNGSLNGCLQALGAAGVLSLGPLKPLPKC